MDPLQFKTLMMAQLAITEALVILIHEKAHHDYQAAGALHKLLFSTGHLRAELERLK